jgi:hypothetical protein
MFAANSFDPRLMWDAAEAAGHRMETNGYEAEPQPHVAGAS